MFGIGSVLSSVAPAVANAVGNLASSVVNSFYNKKAASKQNKYTYSLIDYENQYNLPVNQRARLEEAGYNPNLALNGVNVQSATGSAPSVQPARVNFDFLQAYYLEQQNELLKKQISLTKSTENKMDADVDKIEAQTKSQELKNKKDAIDLKFYEDTGIEPDSWQGNSVKPIWHTGKNIGSSAYVSNIGGAYSDYEWNDIMRRAREKYNRMRKK